MASSLDPVTPAGNSPVVPTITSQVQQDLPSLAEARQLEQLMGVKPNLWRRLQDFSGSSQMRTCLLFLPPALRGIAASRMIVRRTAVLAVLAFMVPPKLDSPPNTDPWVI